MVKLLRKKGGNEIERVPKVFIARGKATEDENPSSDLCHMLISKSNTAFSQHFIEREIKNLSL